MAFDPITEGLQFAGKLVDKFIPDATQAAQAKADIAKMQVSGEFQLMMGQLAVNQEEAKSTSWFIAGWRPFVGWICGMSLLYVGLFAPIGQFLAKVVFGYTGQFPTVDTSETMQLLFGMLGIGVMRTVEKVTNSEGNR